MKKIKQLIVLLITMCVIYIPLSLQAVTVEAEQVPNVNYQAHVQNIGWQGYVKNGAVAGTFGRSLRVESFRMNLSNLPVSGNISYATHVQNIGWQAPRTSNQISGTTGQSLRMEAMRISLTGEIAKRYDVYYRTHVENVGWLGWAKNGQEAGTEGRSLRMEAIEIKLVKKGNFTPQVGGAFLTKLKTYTTRFAHVSTLTYPGFEFDYPSNWRITSNYASVQGERVVLENERGVEITYLHERRRNTDKGYSRRVKISKVAESQFVPSMVQATKYQHLGKFAVVQLKVIAESVGTTKEQYVPVNGKVLYAVLPEKRIGIVNGVKKIDGELFGFDYGAQISLTGNAKDGKYTEKDTAEIIQILSTFRTEL